MEYSKKQQIISSVESVLGDNKYITNKKEKGQQRFFTCICCGDKIDLKDSIDYVGAVDQWKNLSEKCYACGNGYCHCKETGKKWG